MNPKIMFVIFSLWLAACVSMQQSQTINAQNHATDSLLVRLKAFVNNRQIAFGHQDAVLYGHCHKPMALDDGVRSDVKDVCGSLPMIVGFDLGHLEVGDSLSLDGIPFDEIRRQAVAHYERGGIVTMSWHARNPVTGGTAWDNSDSTVVDKVLRNDLLKMWHHRLAQFFLSLKTQDGRPVPVLFRPWHEMTGSWFWWGHELCDAKCYKRLYRCTFEAMRKAGVKNLVYAYSTGNEPIDETTFAERYPGDDVVDVVGFDFYHLGATDDLDKSKQIYMSEMKRMCSLISEFAHKHGKLAAICETGLEGVIDDKWWTQTLLPITEDMPLAYVLVWRNAHDNPNHFYAPWSGHRSRQDFIDFFNNPKTVFLND